MISITFILEVCIETVADAITAAEAGADRLELCAALDDGGLTPAIETFAAVKSAVSIPVVAMIRLRPGHFRIDDRDLAEMATSMDDLSRHRPDGFIFGAARGDGRLDRGAMKRLREAAGNFPSSCHRAFDTVPDPTDELEWLIDAGFDRVLTSGRPGNALDHLDLLKSLMLQAKERIAVMPGSGVRADGIERIVAATGCRELHGSFHRRDGTRRCTDRSAVRLARQALDRLSNASG